jgi:Flp pilus assembly protein TadD/transglutaminase-like putative cysteine protease
MFNRLIALVTVLGVPLTITIGVRAQAPAKPAGPPDHSQQAFIIEESRTAYRFENDGTGRREVYVRVKTQSEAGVQYWGQLALGYTAATERMDIQFVRVRKADGTVVTAPADSVQDLTSPVQREAPVYTDFRQKHVTVPSLRPGETLEFSAVTTVHTPVAAGHFWLEYDFQKESIILSEQLEVDVPSSRTLNLKTAPDATPAMTDANGRRVYRWSSSHTTDKATEDKEKKEKDDHAKDADSEDEPKRAAVRLTTFQGWDEVGRWYSALEKGPRTPTPDVRRKAAELTAGKTTDMEKVEALYDFVAPNFRYVSISLGTGRFQPRAAADVLRDQYGDCKDKHTLLASLLESIGVPVSTVLIHSQVKVDPDFASPSQFDHAITRAVVGKEPVWLDVTTEVAPFRLLSINLRKKQALVVSTGEAAHLEETPADPPMMNSQIQQVDVKLGDLGKLSGRIKFTMRGDMELLMRTVFRRTPEARWKDVLEQLNAGLGIGGDVSDWKVSDPSATRRPFEFEYQVSKVNYVDWTKKEFALRLPVSDFELPARNDSKTPIELGSPVQAQYSLHLELGPGYKARAPMPVSVSRDYGEYRAAYKLDGNVFSAKRELTLRTRTLPAERTGDYSAFRRVVVADGEQALALDLPATRASDSAPDLKAGELHRSGYEALRSGDYAQAVTLLKRVVELEPKNKSAWNNLGQAYLGLRQIDAAIESFKKQLEVNAYDEYAYNYLGQTYLVQRRYAEAEAALNKQIELNPLDKFAHGNLARVYVETKKYAQAIPELERAISLSADDTDLHVELGTAYLNLDRNDEALASFARAAELSPTPATWNNVAYQLSLKGVFLDRAQQYAESALSAVTADSRNFSISHVTMRELAVVSSIAANLDTLGWVYFAKGDFTRAERLVGTSWWLGQSAEVGDHLAQIYAKRGRRDDAVATYAAAMSADRPLPETRGRLAALAGTGANVDDLVRQNAGELVRARTVTVAAPVAATGTADFFLLFGSDSAVEAVSFITGEEKLKPMADSLRSVRFGDVLGPDFPAKILRRGTLACAAQCTLTLVPARDARPAR